jgi:hypothetical protein
LFENYFHYDELNRDFIDKFNVIVNEWIILAGPSPIAVCMHKIIVTMTTAWNIVVLLLIILVIYDIIECLRNNEYLCRLARYYTFLYSSRLNRKGKKEKKAFFLKTCIFFSVLLTIIGGLWCSYIHQLGEIWISKSHKLFEKPRGGVV